MGAMSTNTNTAWDGKEPKAVRGQASTYVRIRRKVKTERPPVYRPVPAVGRTYSDKKVVAEYCETNSRTTPKALLTVAVLHHEHDLVQFRSRRTPQLTLGR